MLDGSVFGFLNARNVNGKCDLFVLAREPMHVAPLVAQAAAERSGRKRRFCYQKWSFAIRTKGRHFSRAFPFVLRFSKEKPKSGIL